MAGRRSWGAWLGLLALIAIAGHVHYWYWPRERPAEPARGGPAAVLVLRPQELPLCSWVPYPHQNLAGLSQSDSRLSAVVEAFRILRGESGRPVPTFGPFPLPPARAMGLCTDREGEGLSVVAEVYPLLARVARWSGRLAGNPWLAGGTVETGGRSLEVRWDGDVWSIGREPESPGEALAEGPLGAVLGLVRLGEAWGPVPSGLYRFERDGPDLILRSARTAPSETSEALAGIDLLQAGISLVALTVEEGPEPVLRAMAMVAGELSEEGRLPAFAVLHRGPGERWLLPREVLGALVDETAAEAELSGWVVAAWESADLDRAGTLVAELAPVETWVRAGLRFALWLEPGRVGPVLHGLADDLERLPLIKRRQVRAWRAAAVAVGAVESSRLLTLTVLAADAGDQLELRLSGGPVAVRVQD